MSAEDDEEDEEEEGKKKKKKNCFQYVSAADKAVSYTHLTLPTRRTV